MKFRLICLGLAAVVSLTSGCVYKHHPCWGFRLHPCQHGGCGCAPACSSSRVSVSPVVYRPTGGDCCLNGGPVIHSPAGLPAGYPSMTYPPVIGSPTPLPGATIIPSHELPNPMPVKPGGN
jgi:hypothetical protein